MSPEYLLFDNTENIHIYENWGLSHDNYFLARLIITKKHGNIQIEVEGALGHMNNMDFEKKLVNDCATCVFYLSEITTQSNFRRRGKESTEVRISQNKEKESESNFIYTIQL